MDADRAERVPATGTEQRLQLDGCRDHGREQCAHARRRQRLPEQRRVVPNASQRHRRWTDVRHDAEDVSHRDVSMRARLARLLVMVMALGPGAHAAAAQQTATALAGAAPTGALASSDSGSARASARVVGGAPRTYQIVSVAI